MHRRPACFMTLLSRSGVGRDLLTGRSGPAQNRANAVHPCWFWPGTSVQHACLAFLWSGLGRLRRSRAAGHGGL